MSDETETSTAPDRPGLRRTARLEAFSDGVFAIAITLLVLDLAVPATKQSEQHLLEAVADQWHGYLGYIVSFSTVGALWLGHNAITDYLDRADTTLLRLNLLLLFFVSFIPFPTRLLSEYVATDQAERVAVTLYGLTLLIAGALLYLLWQYALHAGLVRPDAADEEITLLTRRLSPGLGGYGLFIVVGLFVPVAAVIGYLVIALFFVIPVRIPRRQRPGLDRGTGRGDPSLALQARCDALEGRDSASGSGRHHEVSAPVGALADWLTGAGTPQRKFAYGTGRRFGGWGCLVQCDSIHRTRGSGPVGDTGSTKTRT